jgi:putative ABC transport system permease protein
MTYVLHRRLGDSLELSTGTGKTIRLRFVAALSDSLFQSELLMSEENFLRLFPDQQGYRFFLLETPPQNVASVTGILEDRLSNFGFDVISTTDRLAGFHRVENTYLSTFQSLGTLGLILGTLGLATVLLRNVLERRRELAVLRAVGYTHRHLAVMIVAENLFLLISGLVTGALCAALAIGPAFLTRGSKPTISSMALLLVTVLATGTAVSVLATGVALHSPLLPALRKE